MADVLSQGQIDALLAAARSDGAESQKQVNEEKKFQSLYIF